MRSEIPSLKRNGSDVPEGVADDDGNGGLNGVSGSEGKSSDVPDSLLEAGEEVRGVKVENGLGEDLSVVVDLSNLHTVFEGLDVELLEEGGLRSLDILSLGADLEILGDFDLALHDLGGNVEGVEEVDLGGIQSGGACGTSEVDGRLDANSGLSGHLVGLDLEPELVDGGVAEDKRHLFLEERSEDGELGNLASELLLEVFELLLVDAVGAHLDHLLDEGLSGTGVTFLEMTRVLLYARRALRICWI